MSDHWRLVLSNGVVVDVEISAHRLYSELYYAACAWEGYVSGSKLEVCVVYLASQVTRMCSYWKLDVCVSAILAPGELTPDERVAAERERCAAIAEAVASERDIRADYAITNGSYAYERDAATMVREIAAKIRKGV